MVSRDFQALSARRASRAVLLATRYPASRELLSFYAALALFQERMFPQAQDWEALLIFRAPLVELVRSSGPKLLQKAALKLDEAACRKALADYWPRFDTASAFSFFARVLLQPYAATTEIPLLGEDLGVGPVVEAENRCPRCGHPPQVGVLRREAEGSALTLVCSLCLHEWPFRRGRCVACGEEAKKQLAYYTASGFDHLQVQACDTCRLYFHVVDLAKEPAAIPDVDELAALPLDVWAQEQGYQKLQPNVAGI